MRCRSSDDTFTPRWFLANAIDRQLALQYFGTRPNGSILNFRPQWAQAIVFGRRSSSAMWIPDLAYIIAIDGY
jgi:hypothetical protein